MLQMGISTGPIAPIVAYCKVSNTTNHCLYAWHMSYSLSNHLFNLFMPSTLANHGQKIFRRLLTTDSKHYLYLFISLNPKNVGVSLVFARLFQLLSLGCPSDVQQAALRCDDLDAHLPGDRQGAGDAKEGTPFWVGARRSETTFLINLYYNVYFLNVFIFFFKCFFFVVSKALKKHASAMLCWRSSWNAVFRSHVFCCMNQIRQGNSLWATINLFINHQ